MNRIAAIIFAMAVLPVVAAGASPATLAQAGHCHVHGNRAALCRFVAAVNEGAASQLLAPKKEFQRYTVAGPKGAAVRNRRAANAYLAERRRQSERLAITWFSYSRPARGAARFRFDLVRSAADLTPPPLYRGTAQFVCATRCELVSLTMAPSTEPSVPAPQTYAGTCKLAPAWCEIEPTAGGVPAELWRPLAFPGVSPGEACPTTTATYTVRGNQFTHVVLGNGPVGPQAAVGELAPGVFRFVADGDRGWYWNKTSWLAAFSDYRGPMLIRGRQLDGSHKIVMDGDGALLVDPQLGPGDTLNGYAD